MSIKTLKQIQRTYIAVLSCLFLSTGSSFCYGDESQSFVYWRGAMGDGRKPYETDLIRLLIEASEDKYGPAKLDLSEQPMSGTRGRFQLKSGRGIDIITAPLLYDWEPNDTSIVLEHDVAQNILGYRRLVIRNSDRKKFATIESIDQLKRMTLGQGQQWRDSRVYSHASMPMVHSSTLANLFPMLQRKRYDYLPIGVNEVEAYLAEYEGQGFDLVVAENIILFYAWPVRIFISESNPALAQRLDYGWQVAQKNGDIDALFNHHFSSLISAFNTPDTRLFILENPYISIKENAQPSLLDKARVVYDFRAQ
jgi:hypothetical protein